jgi:hypothetical protein
MKITLSAVFLATIFVFSVAQEKPTALAVAATTSSKTEDASRQDVAQDPITEDDLNAILDEIALTSVKLKKVEEEMEELKPKILDHKRKLATHDANPCMAPPDNPNACAAYNREAAALDKERDELRPLYEDNLAETGILRSKFGILKARLRIMTMLFYECNCGGDLGPEAAHECWSECVDSAAKGLPSCLDMNPSDVAACLEKLR